MVTIKNSTIGNQSNKNGTIPTETREPPKKKPPGVFSRLFFMWMLPLFYFGNFRDLEEPDLVPARKIYNSKTTGDKLERLVETVHTVRTKFFRIHRNRSKKFSDQTLKLMEERNEMRLQSLVDAFAYRRFNRQISKSQIRDLRSFNTNIIKETIEQNEGSKMFARDLSIGQSQLTRLKTDNGSLISSKPEILREVETFYGQLYTSTQKPVDDLAKDPRATRSRAD